MDFIFQDGKIEAEDFTSRLYRELNSSPQPYLVPFLKVIAKSREGHCTCRLGGGLSRGGSGVHSCRRCVGELTVPCSSVWFSPERFSWQLRAPRLGLFCVSRSPGTGVVQAVGGGRHPSQGPGLQQHRTVPIR